jgi:hypothetical protein
VSPILALVLLLPCAGVVRNCYSIPAKDSEYQKDSEKGNQDSEKHFRKSRFRETLQKMRLVPTVTSGEV